MYRFVDAIVVRAAVRPETDGPPPPPALPGEDEGGTEAALAWVEDAWSRAWLAEAVEAASPGLARRVDEMLAGTCTSTQRVRRVVTSLARYALRATGRPTPFGLFAGVASVKPGSRTRADWAGDDRPVLRPSGSWLGGIVDALARSPALYGITVVANNLAFVRGARLVVPVQARPAMRAEDEQDRGTELVEPCDVSVRRTAAVAAALSYARSPIRFDELVERMAADFPDRAPGVVEDMLRALVLQRVLLTALRPPTTAVDALDHVLVQLGDIDENFPAVRGHILGLRAVRRDVEEHNAVGTGGDARRQARARVTAAAGPGTIDLRLGADVVLAAPVLREAETAARALTRLTPHPFGMPAWVGYHHAFLERYGPGATVALAELLTPGVGLGLPATFRGSGLEEPPAASTERDRALVALVAGATLDRAVEVVLDEERLDALATAGDVVPPPHVELCAQVHAETPAAVDAGRFRLVVTGASRAAGTTAGRFLHLLDEDDRARFASVYSALPTLHEYARAAQVSCPPVYERVDAVARVSVVAPYVVSVGEYPARDAAQVQLDDLAVTADADGLMLISRTHGLPVEPTLFNAVELRHFSHPVARFLHELDRARTAVYMPFTWGLASRLPVLPRLRLGRTVLTRARWNLPSSALPAASAPSSAWRSAFDAWRDRHHLPARVLLGEADQLLPLDLDEVAHLALLRADLDRRGHASLEEAPPRDAFGWCGGRAHEVVVPLASTRPPRPAPGRAQEPPPPVLRSAVSVASVASVVEREHGQLPGASCWLYAKVSAHADRHEDLVLRVPELLAAWAEPPAWWFVRYRDPEPHLRLRLRLPRADCFGAAAGRVARWAAGLRAAGLAGSVQLDTYFPETGRYGTGAAMAAAESVFAADSAVALAQLQLLARSGRGLPAAQALTAASLVDLAVGFAGTIPAGMHWLVDHVPNRALPRTPRELQDEARRLADPRNDRAALRRIAGGEHVLRSWRQRGEALATYRAELTAGGRPGDDVLASLLHMHHIRMHGLDVDSEHASHRLARAAALSWCARPHPPCQPADPRRTAERRAAGEVTTPLISRPTAGREVPSATQIGSDHHAADRYRDP